MTNEAPALIVGGGGAGLTASMLLSTLGVEHILVSALPHTSLLPKAHVLNQRAMEIFEEVGVAGRILEKSTPAENMRATGWYAGITGSHDGYGRCSAGSRSGVAAIPIPTSSRLVRSERQTFRRYALSLC